MTTVTTIEDVQAARLSAVSWAAVIAGAIASLAVTLLLLAFGTGVGFTVISPWNGEGVSASTFHIGSLIYLVIVAVLSSTVGGMLAGRLRGRWIGVHHDEVYFRDTAHGFLAWALATVLSAAVIGSVTTHMLSGATGALASVAGPAAGGAAANPNAIYVDALLRTDPAASNSSAAASQPTPLGAGATATPAPAPVARNNDSASRAEIGRIFTSSMRNGALSPADRTYVAKVVAARTGMSQADAEKRVDQVVADAKKAADDARKAAATLAFWIAAAMVAGALAASLAATEGGVFRDTRWYEPGWRKANARTQYMS